MALKGTIQDFGVADILQLIGQQCKTGQLSFSNEQEAIHVFFDDGAIVYAENINASPDRLLGNLLIRAEIIEVKDLRYALQEQQRTLKRIGTILIELDLVERHTVIEFARLQMMETLYGLFHWHQGTYEFESYEVDESPDGVEPIRPEMLVMNGIRMVDEWPTIRARIPSFTWIVEAIPMTSVVSTDQSYRMAEERVLELLAKGRTTVRKLVDRSRLGEFETCRALNELANEGLVRILSPEPNLKPKLSGWAKLQQIGSHVTRVVVSAGLVWLTTGLIVRGFAAQHAPLQVHLERRALEHRAEWIQRRVIERALEVYRLRKGVYPDTLEALLLERLVQPVDLRRPYSEPYVYFPYGAKFELHTPLW